MASRLKQFKTRALARTDVKMAYDELAEEFAFFDDVLKARTESGLTQAEVAARWEPPNQPSPGWNPLNPNTPRQSPPCKSMRRLSDTRLRFGSSKMNDG